MSIADRLRELCECFEDHSVGIHFLNQAADHIDALEAQVKALKDGHATAVDEFNGYYFEDFWKAYPRKVGKVACLRSWKRMHLDQLLPTILDALAEHKRTKAWQKNGGEFIPHPTTWINQRRWEDELQPQQQGTILDKEIAAVMKALK